MHQVLFFFLFSLFNQMVVLNMNYSFHSKLFLNLYTLLVFKQLEVSINHYCLIMITLTNDYKYLEYQFNCLLLLFNLIFVIGYFVLHLVNQWMSMSYLLCLLMILVICFH